MAQVKALFYLPITDNDGRDLRDEIEEAREEVYNRFEAWSFVGYVRGAWRMMDGEQAIDESHAYVIVLEESRLSELEEVLLAFKQKTMQEAMYLEIQRNIEVRLLK